MNAKVKLPAYPARTRDPQGQGHEMQAATAETLLTFPRMRERESPLYLCSWDLFARHDPGIPN